MTKSGAVDGKVRKSKKNASPRPIGAPKGMSKADQRAQSMGLILDAAERLFAIRGLYGVTIKDVANEAGVHTSLLHYYFDDKQHLFESVVERRAPKTISLRTEALDKYEEEHGDSPTVEGILKAYLDTDLELYISGGEGWRNYGALAGQINNAPEWGARIMGRFDDIALRLIGLLKKAMPNTQDEDLFWGFQFVSGALTHTLSRTGRIDTLSGGLCKSDDFDAIKVRMAAFMAGGFKACCLNRASFEQKTNIDS